MARSEHATAETAQGRNPGVHRAEQGHRRFRWLLTLSLMLPALVAVGATTAPAQADGDAGTTGVHAGALDGTETNEPQVPPEVRVVDRCEPGGSTDDRIIIPSSEYFTYTVNGTTVPPGRFKASGTRYVVEAVPNPGVVVEPGATTRWTFTFTKDDCVTPTPVRPAAATAADVCEPASGLTNDRITIPTDPNFTYTVDGAPVAAGQVVAIGVTHTVNAFAKSGVVVEPGATTQWTFPFTKVACVTPPTPARPAVAAATDVCEPASGPTNDRILIPTDASFTYTVDGVAVAAGPLVPPAVTHVVRAVAKAGVVVESGAPMQWTFTFTKVLCSEVLGNSAARVKGAVKEVDKCGRAGDAFRAKRVRGVTYLVKGSAVREGVWLKARTRTVKVRAVATSSRFRVVGASVWTLRFTNERCAPPPEVLPATGA